jgi:hypothetical protein
MSPASGNEIRRLLSCAHDPLRPPVVAFSIAVQKKPTWSNVLEAFDHVGLLV